MSDEGTSPNFVTAVEGTGDYPDDGWGSGVRYKRLRGTTSWLGFPKSDELPDDPGSGS